MFYVIRHLNTVDHVAVYQVLQDPAEMLRRDAKHGGAQAAGVIESDHHLLLFGKFFAHSIDQMDFGSYGKLGACRGIFDDLDQAFGGADAIGLLADLPAALGMDDDLDAWVFRPNFVNVLRQESLMYRAMSFPK